MRAGFIGVGNMGGAIATGLIQGRAISPSQLFLYDVATATAQSVAEKTGASACESAEEVISNLGSEDVLFLAVKPAHVASVLSSLAPALDQVRPTVISMAAGTPIATLADALGETGKGYPLARIMPNVNAAIRQSMTALCANDSVSSQHLDTIAELLESIGLVAEIAEEQFAAFSAMAGCSPAWTAAFVEALARAGVRAGLPKAEAVRMAAQAVRGTGELILTRASEGITPRDIEDQVSSPAGTTVAGALAMEAHGFSAAVHAGVQAAIERDVALSLGD